MQIVFLAWVCGLGLGNHTTYALISPLAILGIWIIHKKEVKKWIVFLCALGWFSGILTYIILPIRAQYYPAVNWGDPKTLEGFLWLIKGGDYSGNIFGIQLLEYPSRLATWIGLLIKQFGIFGMLAGFVGISKPIVEHKIKWATVYIFSVYSIFAIGYKTNDSIVYVIPALIVFSMWIAWGIISLWQKKWKRINLSVILAILIFANIIIELPSRYQSISPKNADLAQYAEVTLSKAPKDSAIYPTNDGQTFSLWFYQYGLGMRPDVKIISRGLLKYSWYRENLFRIYPNLKANELQ